MRVKIDYSKKVEFFSQKGIKNQVEHRLRDAGIKAANKDTPFGVFVNFHPDLAGGRLVGYRINIIPQRYMYFESNGKKYVCYNASNHRYSDYVAVGNKIGAAIKRLMDEFLSDHLKANPKEKE